jgi:carboxyl-terminal processing protease
MNKTGRNILIVFLALFLLAGTFSGGLILGWMLPQKGSLDTALQTNVLATPASTNSATDTTKLFEPFWQAWQLVHEEFVNQPVDDTKLMEGAIRGMMDSLGDKHTSYMSPEEYKQATMPLDGSYEGIGAYVDSSSDFLTIITPMVGSPAEAAGLKAGDEITAVDGKDMAGIDPNIVLQSVLGPSGSSVVLTVHRPDPESTFDVTIKRAKIVVPTLESKMLDEKIGYIALASFGDTTTDDLKKALTELMAQNPKGLILDLRNNGGGYLTTAIEVVSQFVGDGVVMYEQEASGTMNEYNAIPGGLATKIPLVVLVNEGTASASEITAGAIQDYGRGVLVGTTTYGKGSVQNWITLDNDQGAVRITVAHWLTPKQRQINGVGLTPDYVVELTKEDIANKNDAQLKKAIEILLNNQ